MVSLNGPNQSRHLRKPSQASGSPATFTGDETIAAVASTIDGHRLEDTVDPDGLGQLVELLPVELCPWLLLVRRDLVQRQTLKLFEVFGQGRRGRRGRFTVLLNRRRSRA